MANAWIDFAVLRAQANFLTILDHYGIKYRSSRGQVSICCPFHDDTNPSMSVSMEDKLFNCFSCGAAGDVLHFVEKMEKVSIREAANIVAGVCGIPTNGQKPPQSRPRTPNERRGVQWSCGETAMYGPPEPTENGNKPLGYRLNLDPTHPYLFERGLTPELIKTFGVGYCGSGILQGRIAIPIFDAKNTLVAYAGRWASDDIPEGKQKYLLPKGFRKSAVLFNFHRVSGIKHLVTVEGYWSVFRLHALEVSAVALMGRTLSNEQEQLLLKSGARLLTLFLDGDEAGRTATAELLPRLSSHFFVRVPELPLNEAPDTVSEDILRRAVTLR